MNSHDEPIQETIDYNPGINSDRYAVWRNDDDIGYVQLAFRIIVEAVYDLLCGSHDDMLSASVFFYGKMYNEPIEDAESYGDETADVDWSTGSMYPVYASIIGYDGLPEIVKRHREGKVRISEAEKIRNLYTTMMTI
jgi:hypothetical protein